MLKSTIIKKMVVALTGLVMFGFVVGHLAGNLQVFLGAQKINDYSAFLHSEPLLLWGTRVILLISLVLHFVLTVQLTARNRQSRPVGYREHVNVQASAASRTMIWGGLFLLFYIVFHLSHLTWGVTHVNFQSHDVYANIVTGFSVPYVTAIYILGMVALGFHLYHGIWSAFQTLGLTHPKYDCARRVVAGTTAIAISAGYILIPVAVLMGILHL